MKARALLLALPVALTLACTQPAPPAPSASDGDAIRAGVADFVAAWNAGDSATVGSFIAADAVLLQPQGPVLQGRSAVVAAATRAYDVTVQVQTATTDEVLLLADSAYARGTWKVDPKPGVDLPAANGKWSTLMQRGADGTWQIARWTWNQEDAPPPPAD